MMVKHTILFLAANPSGTDRLALDEEARAIQTELERSGFRDTFELVTRWAVRPLDLLSELRKLKPTIVHFSGHGGQNAEPVQHGGKPQHGLFFQGPDGQAQLVTTAALTETFEAAGRSVRLVVLNACYSEAQADALLAHVDCVVGMSGALRDDAAKSFAIGFYGGLGARESVMAAYRQGRAALSLEGLPDSDRPQLKVRAGVDAGQLVLTDPRASEDDLVIVAVRKQPERGFPVFHYTIKNNSTKSQILSSIRVKADWISFHMAPPQTRTLDPMTTVDIILPEHNETLLLDIPIPVLIAPDDAATIGVRFACGDHDKPIPPGEYGHCNVTISFISDRKLRAESDSHAV